MFSYDKDIYKRIMKPAGLQYLVDSDTEKELKKHSPKNQEEYWNFLYPQEIVALMGISRPEAFSSISKGNFDKQYVSISTIDNLKLSLKGKNSYLKAIYDHLCRILEDCASIDTMIYVEKKSEKSLSVNREIIDQLHSSRSKEIEERKQALVKTLSFIMDSLKEDILNDKRFSSEISNLINELIEYNPMRVLGLLCTFALFPEDDNDLDFIEDISNQYSNGVDIGLEYIKKETVHSHDLTPFINITKESVLYRESEYDEIIDVIGRNKGIVLSGFGGSGKTSIARLVFSHLKSEYDYCGWINYNGDLKTSMIADIELDEYSDATMTENDIQKKWKYIVKMIANGKKSKIFVIDNVDYIEGVQSPIKDEELAAFSGWDNIKVIITSRLPKITGYDNVIKIKNLGDEDDCDKCIELFYYYNPDAAEYRASNYHIVKKICELAGYNTMAIELLAKDSRYDADNLDKYYRNLIRVGFKYADEVPVETNHDFTRIEVRNEDGTIEHDYYNRGSETAASQLMKLFNMKQRSLVERQILWDFHCLPEAERVSKKELREWLGYSIMEIDRLKEESWIKYEDGFFFMHPLINQAVSCTEEDWEKYWRYAEERRTSEKIPSIVTRIREHNFFDSNDGFVEGIRKIYFADYLSYGGRFLDVVDLLYIADRARKIGVRDIGLKYYKNSYDLVREKNVSDESKIKKDLLWRTSYYYGYMLSYTKVGYDDAYELVSESATIYSKLDEDELDENERSNYSKSVDHLGYIMSYNVEKDAQKDEDINVACRYLKTAISLRIRILANRRIFSSNYYERTGNLEEKNILCNVLKEKIEAIRDEYINNSDLVLELHDYAWSLDNLGGLFSNMDFLAVQRNSQELGAYEFHEMLYEVRFGYYCLKEALNIRKKLAESIGDKYYTEIAWTYRNLVNLLMWYNPDEISVEEIEQNLIKAMEIYDYLEKYYPGQHASSKSKTYISYARVLLKYGKDRKEDALEYYKKAISINEVLNNDYPGLYEQELKDVLKEVESLKITCKS